MTKVRHIKVSDDDDGQRLDRWLKKRVPDIPYGLVQKLIRQGQLRVDGKRAKADTRLKAGQDVRLPPVKERAPGEKPKLGDKAAAFIKSLVIYDDGEVIAINKPFGLATQGGTNTRHHVDGMLDALKNKQGVRPRLVHRLDKDTSGVLLLARSAKVARELGEAFKGRDIKKIYWAVVSPVPSTPEGVIRAPIGKGVGRDKDKMIVDEEEGKKAYTDYIVLEQTGDDAAFVAFWPRTGRTHQIRLHAQVMECPIVGDVKYGASAENIAGMGLSNRLHLHARRVILPHPVKKGKLDITAPLPDDLLKSWKALGFSANLKNDPFGDS
ncbi:MAG: RluA family pseudouridine synthase [Alphaproteobacteria bacterium]|nr:RluA family pseudouridine synthase [Alphaproteobacteria bacterium]